jgi:NitT/TauT family transport system substrate-binding protein
MLRPLTHRSTTRGSLTGDRLPLATTPAPQEEPVLRRRTRPASVAHVAAVALTAALALAACAAGSSPSASSSAGAVPSAASPSSAGPASPSAPGALTKLTVGLGYIPSVQFAQFYLADQAGYYRDAGLEVTLENKIDPDLVTLIGQGSIDIGNADGTSVIPAVSQGIPIRYAATIYGTNPSIVVAKASSGITSAADLKGRKIGIPGKYGSSWIMLQALLASVGLTPNDVQLVLYPDFGQAVALQQGAVDAATGFANNEPVQLRLAGEQVVVLGVPASTPLPGPGLITSTGTLADKTAALQAFVGATIRAMDEIAADPQKGIDASAKAVPELGKDPSLQLAILRATIDTWKSPSGAAYGTIDRAGWQSSLDFMTSLGLVPNPVTVDQLVTDELLPR